MASATGRTRHLSPKEAATLARFEWRDSAYDLRGNLAFATSGPTTLLGVEGWRPGALPSRGTCPQLLSYLVLPSWDDVSHISTSGNPYTPNVKAIAGSEHETTIADHAFSCVAACPPYVAPDRLHAGLSPYTWIPSYAAKKLVPDGVLLLILPMDAFDEMSPALARAVLARFEILTVGQLPFRQNFPTYPIGFVLRVRPTLAPVKAKDARALSTLIASRATSAFSSTTVTLPAVPSLDVTPFESSRVNPDEALALVRASNLFDEVATEAGRPAGEATPPLPLRLGHVALQLATGRLDGVVGDGPNRHIVKGRVVRRHVSETETTQEGETTVTHDVLGVEIAALGPGGKVFSFASGGEGA